MKNCIKAYCYDQFKCLITSLFRKNAYTPSLAKELSFPEGVCAIVGEQEQNYDNLKILTESKQRSTLGEKGYQLVQEKFSLAKMVERYDALYSHVLASKKCKEN
jgi:glycosyltransferase involved in cell wall biosynthesis